MSTFNPNDYNWPVENIHPGNPEFLPGVRQVYQVGGGDCYVPVSVSINDICDLNIRFTVELNQDNRYEDCEEMPEPIVVNAAQLDNLIATLQHIARRIENRKEMERIRVNRMNAQVDFLTGISAGEE